MTEELKVKKKMILDELKSIKKTYGEDMMHYCRDSFPTILDKKGKLSEILSKVLAPTHSVYRDLKDHNCLEDFKIFVNTINDEDVKRLVVVKNTPSELLAKIGYDLYECKTEEDIQSFKKYYAPGEEICTFHGGRLRRCYVFFAVKKNVDEIRREDFKNPRRQDQYGTSVISIQFTKDETNTLSIKNRYNDTVFNPDATFFNNLDNMIPGLTKSFEYYYNLRINYKKTNDGSFMQKKMNYVLGKDGRFYRYNLIIGDDAFCENNVYLKDGEPHLEYFMNKERYILMDNYVVDRVEKKITLYNGEEDSFTKTISELGPIKNIDLFRNRDNRLLVINYYDGKSVAVRVDEYNNIIEYENNYVDTIGNDFLKYNRGIKRLCLANVKEIGDNCLYTNNAIEELIITNCKNIGGNLLYLNKNSIKSLSIPEVELISYGFMFNNNSLESLTASNVRILGNNFMYSNKTLREFNIPNDVIMGLHCLYNNEYLKEMIEGIKNEESNNKRYQ